MMAIGIIIIAVVMEIMVSVAKIMIVLKVMS